MALIDLSLVTSSLMTLLTERVKLWYPSIAVVAQSPDKLPDTTTHTLSLYLYHASEDPHFKNAAARGGATIERTPLALSLYYVLTAHHQGEDDQPHVPTEQKLMGYGLKAMHDYPVITDATQIGPTLILDSDLRGSGNKLQIIYRPVAPEDSVTFWNGDDGRLIRFSAFYEVRVVMLEPEPVVQLPGYVLSVGSYVLPTGVVQIASTHGVVRFTPPGGDEVVLASAPARVTLKTDDPAGPPSPRNQLVLRGSRLGGGRLVLRSPLFDTANNQIAIDPTLNPDWAIQVTSTQVTARVQPTVNLPGPVVKDVLPGIYGVSIQISTTYPLPGDQIKTVVTRSNEHAVSFTPHIALATGPLVPAPAPVTLDLVGVDLTDSALDGEIEVFVAGIAYAEATGSDPGLKEFKIDGATTMRIGAHFGSDEPGAYPFRLVIRGCETAPFWIEVAE